ncbi:uncharacterized protein LOC136033937 isoform X2 [Artemia franciscana]
MHYTVLQDQIEIYQESNIDVILNNGYSKVTGTLRLLMERDDTSPGFCLLRCVEQPKKPKIEETPSLSSYTDGSELYSKFSDYDIDTSNTNRIQTQFTEDEEITPPPLSPGEELLEQFGGTMLTFTKYPLSSKKFEDQPTDKTNLTSSLFMRNGTSLKNGTKEKRDSKHSGHLPNDKVLVRRGSQFQVIEQKHSNLTQYAINENSDTFSPRTNRYKQKKMAESRNHSSESLASSSEGSIYARIDDVMRPLPSRQISVNSTIFESQIKQMRTLVKEEEEDDRNNPLNLPLNAIYETRHYLSSHLFLINFSSSIFHDYMEKISKESLLNSSSVLPPSIYVYDYPQEGPSKVYVCTPALQISWPDACFEWSLRPRNKVKDNRTGLIYKWPHHQTIEMVRQQGCYLYPNGDSIKGISTAHSDLQWEISFDKAQSLLLNTLTPPQMRSLYWALLIFRDQISDLGCINTSHIINILFYMLESNYGDWSEVNIGDNLRLIYENLHACLIKKKLPNYFLIKQNLFRSKQVHSLRRVQERVFRVSENIVPHIISIGKQLQSSLYPLPDFDKLRGILTDSTTSLLAQINPALLPIEPKESGKKVKRSKLVNDEEDGFWSTGNKEKLQKQDPTQQYLRDNYKKLQADKRRKEKVQSKEEDTEMFTLTKSFSRTQTQCLIEFFIDHFLELVRTAVDLKSYKEANILLDHCDNLVTLLKELGMTSDVETFSSEMYRIRLLFKKEYVKNQKTVAGLDFHNTQKGENWVLKKTDPLPDIPKNEKRIDRSTLGKSLGYFPETNGNAVQLIPERPVSEPDFTRMWVEAQVHSSFSESSYVANDMPNVSTYDLNSNDSEIYDKIESLRPVILLGRNDDGDESTDL